MIKIKSLLLSGVGVSIAVLIGRLFGFLRENLQASSFGQSYQADALSLSLILPEININNINKNEMYLSCLTFVYAIFIHIST